MENIENQAARQSLPLMTRVARHLVCSQLGQLGAGQLVVRETGGHEQVFGDGEEILKIESTLAEAIQRFNDNFRKEETFNGQVQQSITLLDSEIIDIVRNEEKLKNKLTELHISLHNYQMSRDYMMAKTISCLNLKTC